MSERKQGKISFWNAEKGYGFIIITYKEKFFTHISQWESDELPVAGDRVTFEFAPPRKEGGLPFAVDVRPVEPATETEIAAAKLALAEGLPTTATPTAEAEGAR